MANDSHNSDGDGVKSSRPTGPLELTFPPKLNIWKEALRLVKDPKARVEDLATAVNQDPVLIIELLRVSNALYFSGGKSAITNSKTAIVRLGADTVVETLQELSERPLPQDPDAQEWLEVYRSRCKRVGIISRILAEAISRNFSDDTQTAGTLVSIGDMLAVMHLDEKYSKTAEDQNSRSAINYRLSQNYNFDVDKMSVNYLRRYGMPEALLFALDREARARTPERAIIKTMVQAASELVDAFDTNKWEKLAPGKRLAPKSNIRMLQMTDAQYLKIYERASEYLFSDRMLEERLKRQSAPAENAEPAPAQVEEPGDILESEIDDLLNRDPDLYGDDESIAAEALANLDQSTQITEVSETLVSLESDFGLQSAVQTRKTKARVSKPVQFVEPPRLTSERGNDFVNDMSDMFEDANTSEELLSNLLQRLIDGPFEKAALICVSKDRSAAIVIAARGPIGNGQRIDITDPLSPLAQCFSKVQSFASKANEASPFGCTSFALSPVDADHDSPVALYADCGEDGALTFEARRIFRTVVELLNQKLPSLPGGIPVEL